MRRIFPDWTYGPGPRDGCWWDETVAAPDWPILGEETRADVVIIGGGFTGMSAALHLAAQGTKVALLEAETPGWGASGRNGGFCCLGGAKLGTAAMERQYGAAATAAYHKAEVEAVALAGSLIETHRIDADTHSKGETRLAHSPRAMEALRREAEAGGTLHEASDLPGLGLAGAFYGGLTDPTGFALNPSKYLFGLARSAQNFGAALFQRSPALSIRRDGKGWHVSTPTGGVTADAVLICTNGYSSEDVPPWMASRYMPAQSTVMVTRPMSAGELEAQGWTSDQMAYDTRNMLHYFRLMPDRRFLFGMRGGLTSSPRAEASIRRRVRRDFDRMFPAWRGIETTHSWSGMVCLSRRLVPFVGPVPKQPGLFAGFAYHGNGVAMGTYSGRALAWLALGQEPGLPDVMSCLARRFPFGRWRRAIMPPAYAALALADL
ncbi:NAD(P)/FAD-dependent oxidoreductase [Lutimaribacter marinistellae]|uniref:NAD(P)/FAD-dependent oxidoreductase n=1 Tax=Lutimaribacter marinistellae TaxID=1820329 RepID=A0ABV7TC23_9RHOB